MGLVRFDEAGIVWRAVARAPASQPKEDAMYTIAVAVSPVAVIFRGPYGTLVN